ncbi:MAG TPA: phage/plasmid primase, P4 family, partial [Ktedonobacteraceae bacterium]|nr:phage/plasmid primase, P4 family [Ktedonobacteraceae bacterium]
GAMVGPVSNDVILANNKLATPGSAKPHLCSLQGKRIAWASETDRGARFDIGQVKFLTGGGAIAARQLYGRDYTFDPSYLLVLLTNHKPHADASDAAFWERLCPIVFNIRFVEHPVQPNERKRDATLIHALEAEASGILAWLVRGCLQWQRDGLRIPASVLLSRRTYREEEDTLGDFLQECCVFDEQRSVRAGRLYEHYKTWASNNSLKYLNGRAFGQEMRKRVVWLHKRTGGVYQGIAILAEEERDEEWVTDRPLPSRSSQTASHADSPAEAMVSGDRSDRTFPKTPLANQPDRQSGSFSNQASLLSHAPETQRGHTDGGRPETWLKAHSTEERLLTDDLSPDQSDEEFDV